MRFVVSINNLEIEMSRQLSNLSWIMENSTENLSSCLKEVDSSIQTTNLLQTIQVFQNYKRNKRNCEVSTTVSCICSS